MGSFKSKKTQRILW